jgi:sulfoacetaldehyde dehydrogenase
MNSEVQDVVERSRVALAEFAGANQHAVDQAVVAIGWSLYKSENALHLAELAVSTTGLGNVADKFAKNQRKTLGTLRDLMRAKTVGLVDIDEISGIARYAKPVGVVAAVTPSTNPAATPINKAMMAVKGGNAIVIAPSPSGWSTTAQAVELARAELKKVGAPADLVQVLPEPVTRTATEALMAAADLVVATGSQNSVRRAYSSGTPAIGVGIGNAAVLIDSTADLATAASKITSSKTFDNATSCSSENSLVILDDVYDATIAALQRAGGHLASNEEAIRINQRLFPNGKLNRDLMAQEVSVLIETFEISATPGTRYLMVEEPGPRADRPLTGEKLSLVLTLYRATDFNEAVQVLRAILDFQGMGHSVGIHTEDQAHAHRLAKDLNVVRVLVNQAHTFGNGGSFDNGLPFTLSMGCGTWGGNSISENLNIDHFINMTHLVTTIPEDRPTEEDLFGDHWQEFGH